MHTETTQIIKHMMSPNAADRPTIDELLAYKFLGRCVMSFFFIPPRGHAHFHLLPVFTITVILKNGCEGKTAK